MVVQEAERVAVGYAIRTLHPGVGDSDALNLGKEGNCGDLKERVVTRRPTAKLFPRQR